MSVEKRFYLFAACLVGALVLIGLINLYQARNVTPHVATLSYSQFLDQLDQGHVRSVTLMGHEIEGALTDHRLSGSVAADDPDLIKALRAKSVAISAVEAPAAGPSLWGTLGTLLP